MAPEQETPARSTYLPLLLTLGLALLIRVVYLYLYQQLPEWEQLTVDNYYHINLAKSIADGNIIGDTTYFRAPFYIWCLGGLFALFGSSLWVARIFGLVVGLLSVAMTWKIGCRLFGNKAGLAAAVLHSLCPIAVYFEGEILLDSLFLLLMQWTIYRVLIWMESGTNRDIFYAGLACGLAAITRPTILIAIPLLLVFVIVRQKRTRWLRTAIVLLIGVAVFVGPIFVRNLVLAHDPVLIASQAGINLYIGNNDSADGYSARLPEPLGNNWRIGQITYAAEKDIGRQLKPGEVSSYWTGQALRWIVTNPGRFFKLCGKKIIYQLANREISNNRALGPFIDKIPFLHYNLIRFGFILPLAFIGVISIRRFDRANLLVLTFVILYILTLSLFFYNSRFRLPLLPYYFIWASAGAAYIGTRIDGIGRKRATILTAAVIIGLFSFFPPVGLPAGVSPQSLTSKGLFHYSRQDYPRALELFRQARDCDPTYPEVNLNIGACFFRMGRADSAACYFERELLLHPQRPKVYNDLASLSLTDRQYEEARQWISPALDLAPYDVTANSILIRATLADTNVTPPRAIQTVREAAQATGDDLYVLNQGVALLLERGETDAAVEFLGRARSASPPPIETDDEAFEPDFRHGRRAFGREKAKTYYLSALTSGVKGQLEQSVKYSRQAIVGDSTFVPAYAILASGLMSQGKTLQADSIIKLVTEKFPHSEAARTIQRALDGTGKPPELLAPQP